jgi:hypothetical protein
MVSDWIIARESVALPEKPGSKNLDSEKLDFTWLCPEPIETGLT